MWGEKRQGENRVVDYGVLLLNFFMGGLIYNKKNFCHILIIAIPIIICVLLFILYLLEKFYTSYIEESLAWVKVGLEYSTARFACKLYTVYICYD